MKRDKQSLAKKLQIYLNNNPDWHKKVELFVIADTWGYSPESVGRSLRTLAEDKLIQVSYYNGQYAKNLAKYSALQITQKPLPTYKIIERDGRRVVIMN